MKSKKRKYVWLSLLLIGVLSIPGQTMAQAEGEVGNIAEESSDEMFPNDEKSGGGILANKPEFWEDGVSGETLDNETLLQDGKPEIECEASEELSGNEAPESLSENGISESLSENEMPESLSENEADGFLGVSANSFSTDSVQQEESMVSENKSVNVVLPTEVPFDLIFWGKEKREAWIRSEQYCIENKGFDDVCITIEGVVSSNGNAEDYVVVASTTEETYVQSKKNVWMYLKWEDEEHGGVQRPEILMGDVSNPGKGEIILKAPSRDEKGEIIGENPDSKAHFSLVGDMKSDMSQGWEEKELEINLSFFMSEAKDGERNIEMQEE